MCNFSLATSERYKDKQGEKKEKTEWHRVVCWGKTAELCNQYLKKGSQSYIEGKLQTRKWTDKDEIEHYTTEVVANAVQFIGGKLENKSESSSGAQNGTSKPQTDFAADDIPF